LYLAGPIALTPPGGAPILRAAMRNPYLRTRLAAALVALALPLGAQAAPDMSSGGNGAAGAQADATAFVRQVRDAASDLVVSAMNFLGAPYKRGGSGEQGFDCSGFTRYVFEMSLGRVLPHRAADQARDASLEDVKRDELKPGDLVFFNTMRRAFSHVGIYIGDGKFIHSPRTGSEVRIEDMRDSYWAKRFNGARRAILGAVDADAAPAPEARR
jgi:cell wall-associated NlpC family hydrolase